MANPGTPPAAMKKAVGARGKDAFGVSSHGHFTPLANPDVDFIQFLAETDVGIRQSMAETEKS